MSTCKERVTLQGHTESVMSVAFCADGKTLASASYDKTVKFWDVATGKERATLKGTEAVRSVASARTVCCWLLPVGPSTTRRVS